MQAITCSGFGDEDVLQLGHVNDPTPGPGQLRILVAAAGINRADLLQRRGLYPPPPGASEILGLECSGTVESLGQDVYGFATGDRVMALLAGGGYAELAVADAGSVIRVPEKLSDGEAGGFPEAFLTAFLNLFMLGELQPGETVLVHGGSGGVGNAAIQLCREAGATILVTAGSEERCRRCEEMGAESAINYREEDFVEAIHERTDGRGAHLILDCLGASYLARDIETLREDGRLVLIGLMGGARTEIDLGSLLRRRLRIIGSTLRALSPERKAAIVDGFVRRFGPSLDSGVLRPTLEAELPLDEAAQAHRLLAAGRVFGKLVLKIGDGSDPSLE